MNRGQRRRDPDGQFEEGDERERLGSGALPSRQPPIQGRASEIFQRQHRRVAIGFQAVGDNDAPGASRLRVIAYSRW